LKVTVGVIALVVVSYALSRVLLKERGRAPEADK